MYAKHHMLGPGSSPGSIDRVIHWLVEGRGGPHYCGYAQRFHQPWADVAEKYNTLQGAMAASERVFGLHLSPQQHGKESAS